MKTNKEIKQNKSKFITDLKTWIKENHDGYVIGIKLKKGIGRFSDIRPIDILFFEDTNELLILTQLNRKTIKIDQFFTYLTWNN